LALPEVVDRTGIRVSQAQLSVVDDGAQALPETAAPTGTSTPAPNSRRGGQGVLSAPLNRNAGAPTAEGELDLLYATFLGDGGYDFASDVAVDSSGAVYLVGTTDLGSVPSAPGSFYFTPGNSTDVLIAKFDSDHQPVYFTYLGGSFAEYGLAIAVGASGAAYATGYTISADFPTTPG